MRIFLLAFIAFCLSGFHAYGQIDDGLRAYYSFDNCDATDSTANASDGTMFGGVGCDCGVIGNALKFDGVDDYVVFFGFVNTYFDDDDFTIMFYYKNYSNSFQRSLVSKKPMCNSDNNFDVRLQVSQNRVISELSISGGIGAISQANANPLNCWQHVAITRNNTILRTYINGQLADQTTSPVILDVDNNAILSLSNSPCLGVDGTRRFEGLIDELRVYNRALNQSEVRGLYYASDQILNRPDTLIFLGDSFQVYTSETCATDFTWTPSWGVSDPFIEDPILSPDSSVTYTLEFNDQQGCTAIDTIHIEVVDPATLGCTEILLPSAFTPNGDGLNDRFLISNPQGISEFLSFEIFDRWGGRVYVSNLPFEGWNGTFQGKDLNPGIFVYQVRFICEGVERKQTGTVTLMR